MAAAPTFVRFCRSLALLSGPVPLVAIVIPAVVVGASGCSDPPDQGSRNYVLDSGGVTPSDTENAEDTASEDAMNDGEVSMDVGPDTFDAGADE